MVRCSSVAANLLTLNFRRAEGFNPVLRHSASNSDRRGSFNVVLTCRAVILMSSRVVEYRAYHILYDRILEIWKRQSQLRRVLLNANNSVENPEMC